MTKRNALRLCVLALSLCLFHTHEGLVLSPVWAAEKTGADEDRNKTEVAGFLNLLFKTMSELDAEALIHLYLSSEETSLVVNGKFFQGKNTIKTRLDNALSQFKSLQITTRSPEIVILNSDHALAYYTFTGLGQSKSENSIAFAGATSLILKKSSAGWKILHEHTSPNIPG